MLDSLNFSIFLADEGNRSKAYIQNLANHNMKPNLVIICKQTKKKKYFENQKNFKKVFKFKGKEITLDSNEKLINTCQKLNWKYIVIYSHTINCSQCKKILEKNNSQYLIYSGFGGEIIKEEIISSCKSIIHFHSGWLPKFRGSTPIYYSIIKEKQIAVSSIIINKKIDSGKIILRKKFPLPTENIDIDNCYDPIIRADLMINTLKLISLKTKIKFKNNNRNKGIDHYIIHPVLKNLAIKMLNE